MSVAATRPAFAARRWAPAAAILLTLLLQACASNLQTAGPPPPAAAPRLSPSERMARAIGLLDHGKRDAARAELAALLAERPGDSLAGRLLNEIDQDPKTLFGTQSYPYEVKPGETMSVLAGRLLGDPLMFYALARFNGIEAPADVAAGRILMIPGSPHRATAATRPRQAPAPVAEPAKTAAAHDPAQAGRLRASALEKMNRGDIAHAVVLLQRAIALDPANPLITRDLARARRIEATVQARGKS